MKEYEIVVDAGHGGDDPGASGNGIIEKDLTLAISDYMYNRFRELGIPVKMTRTTDETISPTDRVNRVLNAFGNNRDVIVVSNHINAGGGEGAEVIYALRDTSELPDLVLNELSQEGQKIRKAYQRRLPSDTSKDYYFMQRNTGITQPITVEYGFLDNTADANKLKNNYLTYAEAVVRAVLDYIGHSEGGANTYTVKAGDSLWSIAKKYNISVEELKAANNLSSNLLQVGQVLKIPTESNTTPAPGEYVSYTVKAGDSLWSIANKYNTTVNDIVNYNNLSSTNLSIGQKLLIPTTSSNNGGNTSTDTYTVKAGDSLWSISQKYNTTVDNLRKINNLSSDVLSVGQKLLVPKTSGGGTPVVGISYTVKPGDSLYAIARQYDTSVDAIKNLNGLTSNNLSIGQVLKIPTANTGVTYVVKSGDNLYSIAQRYNTTVDAIKQKNNLSSNTLSIGQVLVI